MFNYKDRTTPIISAFAQQIKDATSSSWPAKHLKQEFYENRKRIILEGKMAAENLCKYFQFGHCKFFDNCRNRHVNELCDNSNCEVINCFKRHPRPCRFYQLYHRCRFEPCSYLHIKTNEAEEIEKLKNILEIKTIEVETLTDKMGFLERQIIELNKNLSCLNNDIMELKTLFQSTQPDSAAADVDLQVSGRDGLPIQQRMKEVEDNNYVLIHAVDDLEKAVKIIQRSLTQGITAKPFFKCNVCGATFQTEALWRSHIQEVHKF